MTNDEHFDYPIPFASELSESYKVYKTNSQLEELIYKFFTHPHFQHRKLFIEAHSLKGHFITRDMSIHGVMVTRYFLENPQQFGHSFDNIIFQIIIRMWKQVFRHFHMAYKPIDKYYAMPMKMVSNSDGLSNELLRTVMNEDYIVKHDDMVKRRPEVEAMKKVGKKLYDNNWKETDDTLRSRKSLGTEEGSDNFEYLCSLE